MALPLTDQPFVIDELSVDAINDVFRRIQDKIDELRGLRNEIVVYAVVRSTMGFKYKDENGTILHGFGDI